MYLLYHSDIISVLLILMAIPLFTKIICGSLTWLCPYVIPHVCIAAIVRRTQVQDSYTDNIKIISHMMCISKYSI